MVKFTVHNLGEHTIDNMIVSGPFKEIVMQMAEMFLAGYQGPADGDLDYYFAEYIIKLSGGQGQILTHRPNAPEKIH